MSVFDEVREHEALGRDFLVWLWFRSETMDGAFDLGDAGEVELWFEGRITLQTDGEPSVQTITCTGENARIREARFALREAKKVTRARLHLKEGKDEWSFELDSTWLNFHALKTPRTFREKGEDPEALFYERMFLLEKPVAVLSALFSQYLETRLSPQWVTEEFPTLMKWVREGTAS